MQRPGPSLEVRFGSCMDGALEARIGLFCRQVYAKAEFGIDCAAGGEFGQRSEQDLITWDKLPQKPQPVSAYVMGMLANRSRRCIEPRETNAGTPWDPADLVFLVASIERGMTIEEVAGFLSRPASEVQEKARQLARRRLANGRSGVRRKRGGNSAG
jgi:hypothetical protein